MMSVVKTHLDKRKQEIKKLANKAQIEMQQVIEEIHKSNNQIAKNAATVKENFENMMNDVKKEKSKNCKRSKRS